MDANIINLSLYDLKGNAFFEKYTKDFNGFKLLESDNRLYFSNKKRGIDFVFIDEILSSVHLFGKGHKEYNLFEGILPFDINFYDNKSKVYEKFGKFEIKKGGGEVLPILGKSNEWSIFNINNQSFRFEFKNDEIGLITLSALKQETAL